MAYDTVLSGIGQFISHDPVAALLTLIGTLIAIATFVTRENNTARSLVAIALVCIGIVIYLLYASPRGSHAPTSAELELFKEARLLTTQRKFSEAAGRFQQLAVANPGYPLVRMNLGVAEMRLGNYGRAHDLFQQQLAITPSDPDTHYNLACLNALIGENDDALQELRQALHLGFPTGYLSDDHDLDTLRGLREFQQLSTSTLTVVSQ